MQIDLFNQKNPSAFPRLALCSPYTRIFSDDFLSYLEIAPRMRRRVDLILLVMY